MHGPETLLGFAPKPWVWANGRAATLLEADVKWLPICLQIIRIDVRNAHKSIYTVHSPCYIRIVYKLTGF